MANSNFMGAITSYYDDNKTRQLSDAQRRSLYREALSLARLQNAADEKDEPEPNLLLLLEEV